MTIVALCGSDFYIHYIFRLKVYFFSCLHETPFLKALFQYNLESAIGFVVSAYPYSSVGKQMGKGEAFGYLLSPSPPRALWGHFANLFSLTAKEENKLGKCSETFQDRLKSSPPTCPVPNLRTDGPK